MKEHMKEQEKKNQLIEISRDEFFQKLEIAQDVWEKRLRDCLKNLNNISSVRARIKQAQADNLLIRFYVDDQDGVSFTTQIKPTIGFETKLETKKEK